MSVVRKLVDKKALRELVPLDGLSDAHFEDIINKAVIEEIPAKKFLFKKGDRDQQTCYLLAGEVALLDGKSTSSTIRAGSADARHPMAPQHPRQLSARALSTATVMRIDSGLLDVMLVWDQSNGYEVNEIHSDDDEDWMIRLLQSELLLQLPAMNIQKLIMCMEEVEVKNGDTVVNQDDEGDFYYIVKQGACVVARMLSSGTRPVKLAELHAGDSFGEEALLSGGKRNASVIMKTDGLLMRLSKHNFENLLKAPLVNQLQYEDAQQMVHDGGVWLDVRLPGEYQNVHLPKSINIPLAALREECVNLQADVNYVVYCDSGRRSASAVFLLGQSGINAHVLVDGLKSVPRDVYESEGEATTDALHTSAASCKEGGGSKSSAEIIPLQVVSASNARPAKITGDVSASFNAAEPTHDDAPKSDSNVILPDESDSNVRNVSAADAENLQLQEKIKILQDELAHIEAVVKEHAAVREMMERQQQEREAFRQAEDRKLQRLEQELEQSRQAGREQEEGSRSLQETISLLQKENIESKKKYAEVECEIDRIVNERAQEKERNIQIVRQHEDTLQMLRSEYEQLSNDSNQHITELEKELAKYRDSSVEVSAALTRITQEFAELKDGKDELDTLLQDRDKSIHVLQQEIGVLNQGREELLALKEGHEEVAKLLEQRDATVQELQCSLDSISKDYEELAEVKEANAVLTSALEQQRLSMQTLQEELNELKAEQEALVAIKDDKARLDEELHERDTAIQMLQAEIEKLNLQHEDLVVLRERNNTLSETLEERESSVVAMRSTLEERESVIGTLQADVEELRRESGEVVELRSRSEELGRLLEQREEVMQGLQQDLDGLSKENEAIAGLQAANEEFGTLLGQRDAMIVSLQQELDELANDHAGLMSATEDKDKLEGLLQERDATIRSFQRQVADLQNDHDEFQALTSRHAEMAELLGQREESMRLLQDEMKALHEGHEELDQVRDSNASLKALLEQSEMSLQSLQQELDHLRAENEELVCLKEGNAELREEIEQREASLHALSQEMDGLREGHEAVLGGLHDKIMALEADLAHGVEPDEDSIRTLRELEQAHALVQKEYDGFRIEAGEQIDSQEQEITRLQQLLQEQCELLNTAEEKALATQEEYESRIVERQNEAVTLAASEWESRCSTLEKQYNEREAVLQSELEKNQAALNEKEKETLGISSKIQEELESAEKSRQVLEERVKKAEEEKLAADELTRQSQEELAGQQEKLIEIQEQQQLLQERMSQAQEESREAERVYAELVYENQQLKHKAAQGNKHGVELIQAQGELEKMVEDQHKKEGEMNAQAEMLEAELRFALDKIAALESRAGSVQDESLRNEISSMREEIRGQLEGAVKNGDGEEGLQDENEILRRELERLYKEQEIAINVGSRRVSRAPSQDVLNVFAASSRKQEVSDSLVAADAALTVGVSGKNARAREGDVFSLADMDAGIFHRQEEEQRAFGNRKRVIIFSIVISCLMIVSGGYWYFMHNGDVVGRVIKAIQDEGNKDGESIVDSRSEAGLIAEAQPAGNALPNSTAKEKVAAPQKEIRKAVVTSPVEPAAKSVKEQEKKESGIGSQVASIAAVGTSRLSPVRVYRDYLMDKSMGPVMVQVPAGTFLMGSMSNSTNFDERPQHPVKIGAFSIAKYEVTFEEYDLFAEATGRDKPEDNGWGRDRRPVINVSWGDAVAYAQWLSEQTGRSYRLPSEAEWEYAARAGSSSLYWWGNQEEKEKANCFACGSEWNGDRTAPVGSFSANPLGLHDMTGNAVEWTQDCYHKNYEGAPTDGAAWVEGECGARVARGGAYRSVHSSMRSAARGSYAESTRVDTGIRLVRD